MNKLGYFISGTEFGLLLALTMYAYYRGFTNDYIFPYVFGSLSIGLNFWFFGETKGEKRK